MTIRLGSMGMACCALVFAACGGGGSIAVEDLGDEVTGAQCANLVSCGLFENTAECEALVGRDIDLGDLIAGVEDGTITYDGDAAADCLDGLSGASCDPSAEENRVDNQACDDAFTGNVVDGGSCYISEQCQSRRCVVAGSCVEQCCVGTCEATEAPAAIGQSCANNDCVSNAFCNSSDVCAALIGAGTACTNDDQCAFGLICDAVNDGPLLCTTTPGLGDPCAGGESCPITGQTCDFSDSTCAQVLHVGDACDPQNDLCSFANGGCNPTSMTCDPVPGVGEPCPGFLCGGGAWCDFDFQLGTSECMAPLANSAACDSDSQCQSGYCDDMAGTCAAEVVCVGMGGA